MPTQLDARQSVYRSALNMAGTAANAGLDAIIAAWDPEIGKLFEDRNVFLTDGGIITFTGTQLQFTENLNIVINQKISGAVPQIISLGSSNQNFTSSGDMWVAVVNRTAGTASTSIVTTGNPLSAVSNANQEVFLIAKRVDAGDGTQRIYWRNGMALNAGQSVRLGASGSGSGNGTGDDLDSLQFRASFNDGFDEGPTDSKSAVDVTAAHTDANAYNAAKAMYTLNYDAAKTIAAGTTTTNINISAVASFTVKTGDVVIYGSQARRITAVATQASFTTEAFTTAPTLAGQVTVSQAVYTKDIYNLAVDGSALSAAFGATTFSEIMVDYEDTSTAGDNIFDVGVAPVVQFSASPDGTTFTDNQFRPTLETDTVSGVNLSSAGTSLYLRFFAKKTSGTGIVNILRYKAFMQKALTNVSGGVINVAYGFLNGAGTEYQSTLSVLGGKSTITLTNWTYAVGAGDGSPYGSLDVYLNGQLIPRFMDSTTTPDASYLETSPSVITLDKDYSAQAISFEILQRVQIVDNSSINTSNISALQEVQQNGFQPFVNLSNMMSATTTTGTPAAGTFYSTVINRAALVDLSQDLKVRMAIERIPLQQVQLLQNEVGPNGEPVWSTPNDLFGQIRFVGQVTNTNDATGARPVLVTSSDYLEITFYGTGLNVLTSGNGLTTMSYSVDGAAPTQFINSTIATAISGRNYPANQVVSAIQGLTLGVHTVKITTANASQGVSGLEVVNANTTNVTVNAGSSYSNGKKLVASAQSSFSYSSVVTGTRGGRVLIYQAADGTIGKAFQATNTSAAALSFAGTGYSGGTADHTNEEVSNNYWSRQFGAGRADDFSLINVTSTNAAFALDDGTTTLLGQNNHFDSNGGLQGVYSPSLNDFVTFTFVGTGVDIINGFNTSGVNFVYSVIVDGTTIATGLTGATLAAAGTYKVVSGLPYGTHTLKVLVTTANANVWRLAGFKVYQPKKPTLPTGAIELADYNVMANYDGSTITGTTATDTIQTPVGTLFKNTSREFTYVGANWALQQSLTFFGWEGTTLTNNGQTASYTFFGTGFVTLMSSSTVGTYDFSVTVDGSLNATGTARSNASNLGAGSYRSTSTTASVPCRVEFTGLTLGLHTVIVQRTAGTGNFNFDGLFLITPIHSVKSNLYADLQNALPVGSQGIQDNRKTTPVKDALPAIKAWSQATAIASSPTTTSTSLVPVPDMSVTIKSNGGPLRIAWECDAASSSLGAGVVFQVYMDGIVVGPAVALTQAVANDTQCYSSGFKIPAAPGLHKVDLYWDNSAGTLTATGVRRVLLVEET